MTSLAFVLGVVLAQAATEVYIPIGRSPGVSGVSSSIGVVTDLAPLRVSGRAFAIDDRTDVYLDRSGAGEPSSVGSPADLVRGARVEVAFCVPRYGRGLGCRATADWIKIDQGGISL